MTRRIACAAPSRSDPDASRVGTASWLPRGLSDCSLLILREPALAKVVLKTARGGHADLANGILNGALCSSVSSLQVSGGSIAPAAFSASPGRVHPHHRGLPSIQADAARKVSAVLGGACRRRGIRLVPLFIPDCTGMHG